MSAWLAAVVALLFAGAAQAAAPPPSAIPPTAFAAFGFAQHPGAQLPGDVMLRDSAGQPVRFGSLFGRMPVLIDFEYDRCTTLCGVMLDQITAALRALPLRPGADYRLAAIDIDPETTPQQAAAFAKAHGAEGPGMAVLTGADAAVRRIADVAGFHYRRDPASGQYAHPAGFLIATPQGTVARYFLDFGWRPFDLRLALSEAGESRIAAPAAQLLLFCYCYDPQTGRYDLAIGRLLDVVGAASVLALAGLFWAVTRRAA